MYKEQDFKLPKMEGFSQKQIEEHLKLYSGYVKNVNGLLSDLEELRKDESKNARTISELIRRFSFEWNGMRMHEYYFEELGGGGVEDGSDLSNRLSGEFGSIDSWIMSFKKIGSMRGIGWIVLCYDPRSDKLFNIWVNDHELGYLAGAEIIIAMDVWEHAYLIDYLPSERGKYIDSFFDVLKWNVPEERFKKIINNK